MWKRENQTAEITQKTKIWKAEKQKRENKTAEFAQIFGIWKVEKQPKYKLQKKH